MLPKQWILRSSPDFIFRTALADTQAFSKIEWIIMKFDAHLLFSRVYPLISCATIS